MGRFLQRVGRAGEYFPVQQPGERQQFFHGHQFAWRWVRFVLLYPAVTVPPVPTISATLTADSQLPADTNIVRVETDVDESLVKSGESGVKLIPKEKEEFDKLEDAHGSQNSANIAELIESILHAGPDFVYQSQPLGISFAPLCR